MNNRNTLFQYILLMIRLNESALTNDTTSIVPPSILHEHLLSNLFIQVKYNFIVKFKILGLKLFPKITDK